MRVYQWIKQGEYHLAVLRPPDLFDQSTIASIPSGATETFVSAFNLATRQMETYAAVYHDSMGAWMRTALEKGDEAWTATDQADLEELKRSGDVSTAKK